MWNTEYFKVTLDLTDGSSYFYNTDSKIPTVIKYCRQHNGDFEKGKLSGNFTNQELHNIIYLLKRGYDIEVIKENINAFK